MQNDALLNELGPLFKGKRVAIGLSGSIAVFKGLDLGRALLEMGAEVQFLPTRNALEFVTPLTLETLSGRRVPISPFGREEVGTHHIELARWADCFCLAPASANVLAKLALGVADDMLTTQWLAHQGAKMIVPAMNPAMWENAATKKNVELLLSRGIKMIGPTTGQMACREVGEGRMLEVPEVLQEMGDALRERRKGLVLVSLGPTRSYFDPVRFLTNRSTGRMGAALAWEGFRRGLDVHCVVGKGASGVLLPTGEGCTFEVVETVSQMGEALSKMRQNYHYFFSSAAVGDWEAEFSKEKRKKGAQSWQPTLQKTPDLLSSMGEEKKKHQVVIGFAAETSPDRGEALRKLKEKNCDFLFLNDVSDARIGFESRENAGVLLSEHQDYEIPMQSKHAVAKQLFPDRGGGFMQLIMKREDLSPFFGSGFVPTMGALHAGHLELVRRSVKENEKTVVSIFVNPKQFGKNEDFSTYPRVLEKDLELLRPLGVDAVFAPKSEEIYPQGFSSSIEENARSLGLCGKVREGHFKGVTTVCYRLFQLVRPKRAYFGMKDAQQYFVLDKMRQDLELPLELVPCETVREPDGLALSSRNQTLTAQERKIAPQVAQSLLNCKEKVLKKKEIQNLLSEERARLERLGFQVEYLDFVKTPSLEQASFYDAKGSFMLATAVVLGKTRLIDNLRF